MDAEERRLGGGEGMVGVYGTIRKTGMQKVIGTLRSATGMNRGEPLLTCGCWLGQAYAAQTCFRHTDTVHAHRDSDP